MAADIDDVRDQRRIAGRMRGEGGKRPRGKSQARNGEFWKPREESLREREEKSSVQCLQKSQIS